MNQMPEMLHDQVLAVQLSVLRQEHRDLDSAISALSERGSDMLAVRRLKKKKLALKDKITALEDQLVPDIIA